MRVRFWQARWRQFAIPHPSFQSRVALVALALAAAAALAALLLLAQTGAVTSAGYRLRSLERLRASQERDLLALGAQVAALQSLKRVEEEAKARWNMAPPERLLYITLDLGPQVQDGPRLGPSYLGR